MNALLASLLCLAVLSAQQASASDKIVVCYFGSWAVYRNGDGHFDVEQIDAKLCTHAVYSFAGLSPSNQITALDPWNDLPSGKGAYTRFTGLTKTNPNLKTLLSIGGYNEGSTKYSNMAASADTRKTFIDSVVPYLKQYGFNGLDLDWEYPAQRGGRPEDKDNFALLVQELRAEFDKNGLLLTAAIGAGTPIIDAAYDIPKLSQNLDYIHVMNFDYHGTWEAFTGINAPLNAKTGDDKSLTVVGTVQHLLDLGAAKEKIVLGIPTYGHSYTLSDNSKHNVYDPSSGAGLPGPYTQTPGTLGYNEICEEKAQTGWTEVYDDTYAAWYRYKDNSWMSYDDTESVDAKIKYVLDKGLAGAMVWSLETEDFHGKCNKGANPLLNAINKGLGL